MKSFAMLVIVSVAFAGLARPANAQAPGFQVQVTVVGHKGVVTGSPSDSFLTFSGPVGIPGVVLQPGAYIFRLVTPSVMQVLDENRSTAYAMFFVARTFRTSRSEVTNDYAVTLRAIRNDAPARVEKLFPPGSYSGYELLYPQRTIATGN